MDLPVVHYFQQSEKHNTACGRNCTISSNDEANVTCKKCLGALRIARENLPRRHLMVQNGGRDFQHYNTACHTVGWKETRFPEAVTCKKCLYIITKSLRSCQ